MSVGVMIVEDEPELRRNFDSAVAADARLQLLAAVGSVEAARAQLRTQVPDVLLVDLGLPDGNGIELIREVARQHPQTDCLVVTMFGDDAHVLASIEAGATGYLLKDASAGRIVAAIHEARAGGAPLSPSIARRILGRLRPPAPSVAGEPAQTLLLTPREIDVLQLVAKGLSFDEVGAALNLSTHTIVSHVKNIYRKLAVHSRGEAVFEARQLGLIP